MKKISKGIFAALLGAFLFASCEPFSTSFTPTEDSGIVVSNITLKDGTSLVNGKTVNLYGSKGTTSKTLSASVTPSFASDTTVYWSSSDENICSLSAETGSSVELTLEGEGTAVVTAKDCTGNVCVECNVVCSFEKTPPVEVTSVNAVSNANNIFFTWTDPTDYDDDLKSIKITSSGGQTTTVPAGVEYGWVKGLNPSTEYTFKFISVDLNGNTSSEVSVTATTGESVDEAAPESANDFVVSSNNGTSVVYTWTPSVSSNAKYQRFILKANDGGKLPESASTITNNEVLVENSSAAEISFIIPDNTSSSITVDGLETGSSYTAELYTLNSDFVLSEKLSCDVVAAPTVSNVSVSLKYTGSIFVYWDDFDNSEYYYKVSVTDGTTTITSDAVVYGMQKAYITGLSSGKTYDVSVLTYDSEDTLLATSDSESIEMKVVLWQIINTYNSSYLFAPYITSSASYYNVCTHSSSSSWKYPYWIVLPSLSTPDDSSTFSLEATDSTGVDSGLYLCIDNVQSFGSDPSGWGYPASSHPYHAYALEKDTITTHMSSLDYASFSLLDSTVSTDVADGYSNWYVWKVGSTGYYLYDTYLNVSGETSYSASNGDYVFAYKETYLNND